MVVKVEVTQQHIDQGKRGCNASCPVALATKSLINWYFRVSVHASYIYLSTTGEIDGVIKHACTIALPSPVVDFISDFDDKLAVKPLSFELNLPDHVVRTPLFKSESHHGS